ncbi:DALR anticodon-binding domain-containing protein, partial [Candidatus Hakubella thermalkaliphila]
IKKKVEALAPIIGLPEMDDLATAYERCNNLSRGWETEEVDPELLQEEQEKVMYERLVAAERKTKENARRYDYAAMIKNLAALRTVVDSFFDRVLVMVEEDRIRANRLSLLRRYVLLFNQLANLSLLSGLLVRESQQSQEGL